MINKKLYHLSFNASLEGVWTPKNPDGLLPEDSEYVESVYPEPSTPRISCAPTIIQCFQAIYPNVKSLFDVNNYTHLDFYVYSPVFKGGEKVMTPDELCKKRMVHDVSVNGRLPITCSEVVDLTPDEFKERKAILDSLFKLIAFGEKPLKVVKQFEYEDENLKRIYFYFNPGENAVYSPVIIRIYRTE